MIKVIYPKHYKELTIAQLKKECMKVFDKKFNNKKVKNKATGATIILRKSGAKHALFARTGQFEKIVCVTMIDEIIKQAKKYEIKKSNKIGDLFMLELHSNVKIDKVIYGVTVFIRGTNKGRFYYDHALIK